MDNSKIDQPIGVELEKEPQTSKKRILLVMFLIGILIIGGSAAYSYIQNYRLKVYIIEKVDAIYKGLSLKERLGQLIMIAVPGREYSPVIEKELDDIQPGSIILFGYNFDYTHLQAGFPKTDIATPKKIRKATRRLVDLNQKMQERVLAGKDGNGHGIPLLISTDQEGGRVNRVQLAVTHFPGAMAIGQTGEPKLSYNAGFINGIELRSVGINFILAPVLDVNNNPANPVINTRSFGTTTTQVIPMGLAYMQGITDSGSVPAVKHFPGHGDTDKDSHIDVPVIKKTLSDLEKLELKPFREAIKYDVDVIMTAHILLPEIDKERVGTISPIMLKDILRKRLQFKGIIISDALEMKGVVAGNDSADLAYKAFDAGVDILLFTSWGERVRKMQTFMLSKFAGKGISTEKQNELLVHLEASVKRVLTLKLKKGFFHQMQSKHVAPNDLYGRYLQENEKAINQKYRMLSSDNWNDDISRRALRSHTKEMNVTSVAKPKVTLVAKTETARSYALFKDVKPKRIKPITALAPTLKAALTDQKKDELVIVELHSKGDVIRWNNGWRAMIKAGLAKKEGKSIVHSGAQVIALYCGSPFQDFLVPVNGGVVFAFSPSISSIQQGIDALLTGGSFREAALETK